MRGNICIARESDFINIRGIWDEQFPADEIYQNLVFSKILPLCKNYILKENGSILTIASLMPMHFIDSNISDETTEEERNLRGWYMFGVATKRGFEGKGLASTLLNHILLEERINGYDFIFERPANQSLINFYLKFGFTKFIKKKAYTFHPNNTNTQSFLSDIENKFKRRFEWASTELLKNLIELGEIDRHIELQTPESLMEECFIAVKPLNNTPETAFDEAFFCFPLE